MEYIKKYIHPNKIPDDKSIKVVIHEDANKTPNNFGRISPSMKLSEVRKFLENLEDFYMGDNMTFLENDVETKIHISTEESRNVSDILVDEQCIHILKNPEQPSLSQFVNKHHLLNGYTSNIELDDDNMQYDEEIERNFVKKSCFKNRSNCSITIAAPTVKDRISISNDDIEPTNDLIDAIEKALNQSTDEGKLNAIEELWKDFGFFFPKCIEFGGRIQQKISFNNETVTDSKKKKFSVGLQDSNLSIDSEKTSSKFMDKNRSSRRVFGGDVSIDPDFNDSESQRKWLEMLRCSDKWQPISYSEVVWICELLDNELQARLLEIFGQEVLRNGTDEVEFDNGDIKKPKRIEIENIHMANNQIYATIYNTKCIHEVFSVHVVYYGEANPTLVIQCIKTEEKKDFKRIIKVAWMIVGFRTDFNFKPPLKLKFNSCTIKSDCIEKIQDLSKVFKFPKNKMYCLLGTCAFRYQDGDEDVESTIIVGHHFCKNVQSWKSCFYAFDLVSYQFYISLKLEANQYVFIKIEGKEVVKPLEIHCILSTDRKYLEMTWNKMDKYPIFKGQKWDSYSIKEIKEDRDKLFFSLLCEEKDCSPIFANVNPKYPTLHLFGVEPEKSSRKQNIQSYVSYLIAS
ncbi:2655_t:CDS:2 [Racocetra persica]|uniref:2655_t:CDS:1 n=1 Tax=Racocetra persica TaxID=160502 RepID=A0ACA9KL59_9GLOM|nr:2655_t:CDS:2 [Racocetra persica]